MTFKPRLILKSNGRAHGWRPDTPDYENDLPLSKKLDTSTQTPDSPTLDPKLFPRIRDQGELGSCTGFGLRNALSYKFREKHGALIESEWGWTWDLSPLAMYWLGRYIENAPDYDTGCEIRDVVDAARQYGMATEGAWPYDIDKFKRKPSKKALATGRWHQAVGSYRCDEKGTSREETVNNILRALAKGMPVVYGFSCFANLNEADANGVVPLPKGAIDGGHCVVAYWADTRSRILWGPNSWTSKWGGKAPEGARYHERGYIGLPFQYFLDGNADDAWAIDIE